MDIPDGRDSGSDDELFEGLDLVPPRKKINLNQGAENGEFDRTEKPTEETALPVAIPLVVSNTHSVGQNYFDCTESNGEEDDDEEEEGGKGDTVQMKETNEAPKWEDFFTTEALSDSQNSKSQSCCSIRSTSPSRAMGSQTPDLFSDVEETPDEAFTLTLSASLSNHSSQNLDPHADDMLILHPDRSGRGQSDRVQSELEASQASSDFDIPCTLESEAPLPEDLLQLYRNLASGEGSRGCS